MRAAWLVIVVAVGGCLRQTEFQCASDSECAGGSCSTAPNSVMYCSFSDPQCGERFGSQAGAYANQCVGGVGIDAGTIDGKRDSAPNCYGTGLETICLTNLLHRR